MDVEQVESQSISRDELVNYRTNLRHQRTQLKLQYGPITNKCAALCEIHARYNEIKCEIREISQLLMRDCDHARVNRDHDAIYLQCVYCEAFIWDLGDRVLDDDVAELANHLAGANFH